MQIFSGNANRPLAQAIAQSLDMRLGELTCDRFPDGEVKIEIHEDVRGSDVFVVQPTSSNDYLMELLTIADALRRASAQRITAVVPYFGYARQDRKHAGRVPITAKLVANLMVTAGVDRIVTVDLHAMQIQGFFDIPVDHLMALPVQHTYIESLGLRDAVVLSPDTGSIKLADSLARRIGANLAIIDKRRIGDAKTEVANVIGEIGGRDVVIIDDMITTAGSMTNAVATARERGAKRVVPVCSHAILCGNAFERLSSAELDELVCTDTVPLRSEFARLPITVLSIAGLLGKAIDRIHANQSVSALFV
ncbi:MAG: ribose-phosphate diphosphokinase [Planctomycetota bacterium]